MRTQFFPSGLLDELVADGALEIVRTGDARYVLRVRGDDEIEVAIWTTRRARIVPRPREEVPPWVALASGADGALESLRAPICQVHLEHMDCALYFLGLSRPDGDWGLMLSSPGYIQARVLPTAAPGGNRGMP